MKRRSIRSGMLRREQGFSLMEMLIAVTIVAMMATALWSVFRTSITTWNRGTESIDKNQRYRSILDLVKKQMASAYGVTAPIDLQNLTAIYPIFSGSRDSVQFVSLTSLRFQDNPGLTLVSYDAVSDGQGSFSLVEREEQYLGLDPNRESVFDRKDEPVIPIFENLASFSFEYFDPGSQDRPARWLAEWDPKEMGRLPVAISMTMAVRDDVARNLSRQMVVPILAKPFETRQVLANPLETTIRRLAEDDPRRVR